jgi:hypothetical protein
MKLTRFLQPDRVRRLLCALARFLEHSMRRYRLAAYIIIACVSSKASGGAFSTHSRFVFDSFNNATVAPFRHLYDQEFLSIKDEMLSHELPYEASPSQSLIARHVAWAGGDASDVLGAFVTNGTFSRQDSVMYSSGSTIAYRRDVATTPFSPIEIPMLRLRFSAVGELEKTGSPTRSSLAFAWQTLVRGWTGLGSSGPTQAVVELTEGSNEFQMSGWDSINVTGSRFRGDFHVDVPYDAELAGYSWVLSVTASSNSHSGAGLHLADAGTLTRSVRLEAVTDLNGVPLRGVAFESGLRYVPEPAIGTLVAPIFGLTIFLYRRRALT